MQLAIIEFGEITENYCENNPSFAEWPRQEGGSESGWETEQIRWDTNSAKGVEHTRAMTHMWEPQE